MPSSSAGAEFAGASTPPAQVAVDVLFVPVFGEGDKLDDLAGLDEATGGEVGRARARGEFRGKLYEIFLTPVTGGWRAGRIALIGAGELDELNAERARRIAATCGYFARRRQVVSI